ncbi:undecaprenyl/decaprenyl-phosphate alpha-N-acetylglucosaminyl 1-phosphate transferase [Candidatus Parcubacteria bacterium]|nr:undecaprenyl/decaprenyl-phosphate alpha-N-acetylglucosaminyl 1-phosphate transferase [Candidatus Parcubacteria bacterium]
MFLVPFLVAVTIGLVLTPLVRRLALRAGVVDRPGERKIHTRPIPYLGGLAIFAAFIVPVLAVLPVSRRLGALLIGITVLLVVGVIDDIKGVNPWVKLFWQITAAAITLAGGIGITSLTNPLGGTIDLTYGRFAVDWGGLRFHVTPIGNLLSVIWMVGLINAINFLDGLDGLACGVSAIAAFIMFLLSVGPAVNQPEVALLAIILAGAALGFLPYNFFPARIFMGDGGAYFLGLTLALLAIYSGGKLATVSLVLGFTIIDGIWTVLRRLYRHTSPFKADRHHFHHLLLDAGLSQRLAVLVLYFVAMVFGIVAVASGSFAKLVSLIVLFVLMAVSIAGLMLVSLRRDRPQP